jgi:hypothetical protein
MKDFLLTDLEIRGLISERKVIKYDLHYLLSKAKIKANSGHKEYDIETNRDDGSKFKIMIRQNIQNHLDFSIILGFIHANSNILFRLTRYNGKSHEHQNKLEKGPRFYDFHIHLATERYQLVDCYKEEHFAESTNRYSDINSAWNCFIFDCNIILPNSAQPKIF